MRNNHSSGQLAEWILERMSTILKHTTLEKGFGPAIVSGQIKSHANHPFVIKKVEEARKTLKKVGLPDIKKK